MSRRWASSRLVDLLVGVAAVLVIAAPMLFTNSGFALDFTNHLWLSWAAGKALLETGHPSYFIQTFQTGVFDPYFAFYGGTLYTVTGGLGELLGGHPVLSFLAIATLAIVGAYGGTVWIGRQLGLSRWLSHVPALVVVTSAYYVSDLYGRGAWTEFVATSAIAPLLASALHLARSARWRFWPVLVFVISTVLFSGSHNITLLWGTTICAVVLAVLWLALGRPRKLPFRRLAMVAGLGAACALVNAWYLVPDVSYSKDVRAHLETALGDEGYPSYRAFIKPVVAFDPPQVLFNPLRSVPRESTVPALYVQIPDWFLIWAVAAGLLLLWRPVAAMMPRGTSMPNARRGPPGSDPRRQATAGDLAAPTVGTFAPAGLTEARRTSLLRVWIAFAALIAALLLAIMVSSFWTVVPFPYTAIQFPFRLNAYVYYTVSALVLVSALALQLSSTDRRLGERARVLRAGLVVACAISIGLCVWQEWVPNTLYSQSYLQRGAALASVNNVPHSWYDPGSFNDTQAPVVAVNANRQLLFNPSIIHGDRVEGWVKLPPGEAPIQTNIAGGAYLVHTSGITQVGRNEAGFAVVRRSKNGSGPVHVVVETAHSAPVVLGWVLSVLASLVVLAVLAWTIWTGVRLRRKRVKPAASS